MSSASWTGLNPKAPIASTVGDVRTEEEEEIDR